jgi:hypothetical protein
MIKFKIVYQPFAGSDVTGEAFIYGTDEENALKTFRSLYPKWQAVKVEATL